MISVIPLSPQDIPRAIALIDDGRSLRYAARTIGTPYTTVQEAVLLVTSSRRPDHWIIPGGGIEPEEEPSVTAIREVLEEAGVCGKLGRCLGVFESKSCNVQWKQMALSSNQISTSKGKNMLGKQSEQGTHDEVSKLIASNPCNAESVAITTTTHVYNITDTLSILNDAGKTRNNSERKHRTEVFVLVVTEELPEWEDAKNMGVFLQFGTRLDFYEQTHLQVSLSQVLTVRG
ncbi:hypothetical protein C0J52_10992 [Blattella germanica]|nr:hypothetical protein C0J52_10992 [Blattella germanica]